MKNYNMEINNLKDLVFYCLRNLNPTRDSFGLVYKTNNTLLTTYSDSENKLRVQFHYEYVKNLDQYKHSVEDTFELTKEELTEYEFTRICAKNDLFDAGLEIFKQDVSN